MLIGKSPIHIQRRIATCVWTTHSMRRPSLRKIATSTLKSIGIVFGCSFIPLFIHSLYYDNEAVFQLKLCFLHAAFKKTCISLRSVKEVTGRAWKHIWRSHCWVRMNLQPWIAEFFGPPRISQVGGVRLQQGERTHPGNR